VSPIYKCRSRRKGQQAASDCFWKINKNKMVLVEKVVLPGLIKDAHQIIFRSFFVGERSIDFADDQGSLVSTVINTKDERLGFSRFWDERMYPVIRT
jgi:hypothetical protein